MTIDIKTPILPESITDGELLQWRKAVGESVERDELLVEIETDKVVLEVLAPQSGVLTEILVENNNRVESDIPIARLEPGAAAAKPETEKSEPAPAPKSEPEKLEPAPAPKSEPEKSEPASAAPQSPAVRKLVAEHQLDPGAIPASGKGGRLTKGDVLSHLESPDRTDPTDPTDRTDRADHSAPTKTPTPTPTGSRRTERQPMSRLRQTIAKRLVQAQQDAAMLTTFNEVDMQAVMTLRSEHKEAFQTRHGSRLGFMSFFVTAAARALLRFPMVNAQIDGDEIVQHHYVDIGIAVASERGLVVPVLRDCQSLSFAAIEQQISDFGQRAGAGQLTLDEMSGGTFTITNGGVFGSLLSTPILNPPQSAILGMHSIQQRPVARDGEVVVRPMMYVALSYDHRLIDGQAAVQFLVAIKQGLEDPARLLLDC